MNSEYLLVIDIDILLFRPDITKQSVAVLRVTLARQTLPVTSWQWKCVPGTWTVRINDVLIHTISHLRLRLSMINKMSEVLIQKEPSQGSLRAVIKA